MRRKSFLVADDGTTPDKPLIACLYCAVPSGEEHKPDCVMRRRTVVLRAAIEYVAVIPEHWTPEDVASYFNEGTWCADNLVRDVGKHRLPGECLCSMTRIAFVREANEHDEACSAIHVADLTD